MRPAALWSPKARKPNISLSFFRGGGKMKNFKDLHSNNPKLYTQFEQFYLLPCAHCGQTHTGFSSLFKPHLPDIRTKSYLYFHSSEVYSIHFRTSLFQVVWAPIFQFPQLHRKVTTLFNFAKQFFHLFRPNNKFCCYDSLLYVCQCFFIL